MTDEDRELQSAIRLLGEHRGRALLGCAWGTTIWTPGDSSLCTRQARQIIVIHDGDTEAGFKLCRTHVERALDATSPHEGHP